MQTLGKEEFRYTKMTSMDREMIVMFILTELLSMDMGILKERM